MAHRSAKGFEEVVASQFPLGQDPQHGVDWQVYNHIHLAEDARKQSMTANRKSNTDAERILHHLISHPNYSSKGFLLIL